MNPIFETFPNGSFLVLGLLLLAAFEASLYWAAAATVYRNGGQSRWLVKLLMVLMPVVVTALYLVQGEPQALRVGSDDAQYEASIQKSVRQLEERLRITPRDENGWLVMARSKTALGQYREAAQAYEKAKALIWNSPSVLVGWAEVRLLANDRKFDQRAQEIVGRASTLAPDNPEVLLLKALAALDRGDHRNAQTALQALRAHYPSGSADREAVESALDFLSRP
jgi:cytochrome c-type biogenesis protein CcmH